MKRHLILLIFTIITGCTSDFEEINTNPNSPVNVDASYLLSSVIVNTAYKFTEEQIKSATGVPNRYITRVVHNADDTYRWDAEGWNYAFSILIDNEDLLSKAIERENTHLEAVALIIKAYIFGTLTGLYGDIPFEEAFAAKEENYTPSYSRQELIYDTVMSYLKRANELLQQEGNLASYAANDPMFQGDAIKWRRFGNSLRIRFLMHISEKKPEAFDQIQDMLTETEKYPLIMDVSDNAALPYLGINQSNSSPLGSYDGDFYDRRPSKVFVDFLKERDDPRLPLWVRPVIDPSRGTVSQDSYVGLPIAVFGASSYNGTSNHTSYETSNYSEFSGMFHQNSDELFNAVLMNAAEIHFLLSEGMQQGKINVPGESAESLYLKGISASMEQYGTLDTALESGYFDDPLVVYNNTIKQILEQKWVSLLFVAGAETWFDHRRTGFPDFPFGPQSIRNEIPYRLPYPSDEATYNAENYNEAIEHQQWANDDNYEKMWILK